MATSNRIPVSVRINSEDADFINNLQIDGTHTLSEKIRELLTEARLAHSEHKSYEQALVQAERFFGTVRHQLLSAERQHGIHSQILTRVLENLPDFYALLATGLPTDAKPNDLKAYEQAVLWRVVRLMDGILQLAVLQKGVAYDDGVLDELGNSLQLAKMIDDLTTQGANK
ncbi:MAG: hypothetical protein Q4G13_00710 [Moraxella sp.]|nr:hypothetical protein [Moraxella sp.]